MKHALGILSFASLIGVIVSIAFKWDDAVEWGFGILFVSAVVSLLIINKGKKKDYWN